MHSCSNITFDDQNIILNLYKIQSC